MVQEKSPSAASFDPVDQTGRKKIRKRNAGNDRIQPGTQFKVIAFDIGQVIVPFDWASVEAGFAGRTGSSLAEVSAAMKKLAKIGYENGKVGTAEFLAELNRLLKSDITREEFTFFWNVSFRECREMVPIVEELARSNRLFALSNTNPEHYDYLNDVLNVYRHFEYRIFSHEVGVMKPEQDIYREVIKYTGRAVRKRDVLFIDDKSDFVFGARRYGFSAIQFTTPQSFARRLKEIGLLS